MEAKFIVTPSLKVGDSQSGVDSIKTDMLMLTKMSGLGLGPGPQAVDQRVAGRLSQKIKRKNFQGNLGESLVLRLPEGEDAPAKNVLMIGLGSIGAFNYCGLRQVMHLAVERAIKEKVSRLSIEISKDRLNASTLNLTGTAHGIKECVNEKLAEIGADRDGTLEVELICTSQAARFVRKGIAIQRQSKRPCCDAPTTKPCEK
jgi:hypothetical protein